MVGSCEGGGGRGKGAGYLTFFALPAMEGSRYPENPLHGYTYVRSFVYRYSVEFFSTQGSSRRQEPGRTGLEKNEEERARHSL